MALAGGEGLWCGASLRPWQILHSRLPGMHTCTLLERDVWELMDETVEAAYPLREYKKEEVQLLEGDDGELWRHGGLMEARIRDWLTSKIEQEREEAPIIVHPHYYYNDCTSAATFSSEFSQTWDHKVEDQIADDLAYSISDENTADEDDDPGNDDMITVVTCSGEFSETWDSTYLEEAVYAAVADALDSAVYDEEDDDQDDQGYIVANVANAASLAAQLDTETRYCQFSEDLQANEEEEEELEALCAVCLEKLYMNEELQGLISMNDITRLPCSHSFHSECLSQWVSAASSICPCCRANISISVRRLQTGAPPNSGGAANCSSDRVQHDMMGLLAEMEAALERFGLLA